LKNQSRNRSIPPEGALDPLTHFVRGTGTGQWLYVSDVPWQSPHAAPQKLDLPLEGAAGGAIEQVRPQRDPPEAPEVAVERL
jgi:hypothetical protein